MFLRKARRMSVKKKSLLLAMVVLAVSSTAAIATTWTVVIGTSGDDTINKAGQPGNYRIYGLAGKDTLTGGEGDSVLIGDGHCPPGSTTDEYCDTGVVPGDGGDTLKGGDGNNVIIGGGGPNKMYGGGGKNYIQAGSSTNLIYGGTMGDTIYATTGSSTIYAGRGANYIDTRGPGIDKVYCIGTQDTVYADANDIVKNCAHVYINRTRGQNNGAASVRKHARSKHASKHSRKHSLRKR
jgi:Ca2+-binding RTX toxin-like protein